jgi:ornithine cyclodeaminase/alanine dehydrogenase-like protein (mu-crystallin family)
LRIDVEVEHDMLVLPNDDLFGLLPPLQVVAAVEAALRAQVAGNVVAPKRLHVDWNGNTLLTMPAAAPGMVGVKVISVAPGNTTRGLPATNGIMILNDAETGVPFVVMDAAALTVQRTGAVGALGVMYLAPERISSVGIVGCGAQGAWQAIYACSVRPIRKIFAYSRSMAGFDGFSATVSRYVPAVRITPCQDTRTLLEHADLVIAATTSAHPVLPDEASLLANKHFISVGSFRPSMQELPDAVYRLAGFLAVDSEHAQQETGDVINPIRRGILKESDVFSIAECVTGERTVDTERTTVHKSVGAALYDLFVAQALYSAAKSQGAGSKINF